MNAAYVLPIVVVVVTMGIAVLLTQIPTDTLTPPSVADAVAERMLIEAEQEWEDTETIAENNAVFGAEASVFESFESLYDEDDF